MLFKMMEKIIYAQNKKEAKRKCDRSLMTKHKIHDVTFIGTKDGRRAYMVNYELLSNDGILEHEPLDQSELIKKHNRKEKEMKSKMMKSTEYYY